MRNELGFTEYIRKNQGILSESASGDFANALAESMHFSKISCEFLVQLLLKIIDSAVKFGLLTLLMLMLSRKQRLTEYFEK